MPPMPSNGGIKTDDTLTGTLEPLISVDIIGIKQHKLVKDHSANITARLGFNRPFTHS
jgi:hypothetical protein